MLLEARVKMVIFTPCMVFIGLHATGTADPCDAGSCSRAVRQLAELAREYRCNKF